MCAINLKTIAMLICFLVPTAWNDVNTELTGDHSDVQIKEAKVQGTPRGSAINASLNGHTLTVVFTENLGEVAIEITTATGDSVRHLWTPTPNGYQTYISQCGDYIITFTLPNGDEYYGEFTVTD